MLSEADSFCGLQQCSDPVLICEMRPRKTDSIKERTEYTYFEIVSFTAENGDKIQSQLYGKGESEERYSIGEQIWKKDFQEVFI